MTRIAVIGAGSWGTALAALLADNGADVALWARRKDVARTINDDRRNPDYLSDRPLPETIAATDDLAVALHGAESALIVTPSQSLRAICHQLAAASPSTTPLLICCKGIELQSGLASTDVVDDVLGPKWPVAVLSGPNHAEEIIRGFPAASVVAAEDGAVADYFSRLLGSERFRTYVSADATGVQLCGAFKNVIAIAVGVSYGLGLGDNTAALLITRGLAEMSRLVVASGGGALTCMGLAGAGDMVVTCMSRHSRNRVFGEDYLAHGRDLDAFARDHHMVVEGAPATSAFMALAKRRDVELPIACAVQALINGDLTSAEVVHELASRPLTEEFYGIKRPHGQNDVH